MKHSSTASKASILSAGSPGRPPTRGDYERLKAEYDRLRCDLEKVLETTRAMRRDLQTQFTRIAEIQAILDEEHRGDAVPRDIRPLMRPVAK